MNYGKAIQTARETAGLTIEQVAEKINNKPEYLLLIEKNLAKPTQHEMNAIAAVIGVSWEIIMVLGIEDKDMPDNRKEIAKILLSPVQELIKAIIKQK